MEVLDDRFIDPARWETQKTNYRQKERPKEAMAATNRQPFPGFDESPSAETAMTNMRESEEHTGTSPRSKLEYITCSETVSAAYYREN